MCQTAPVSKAMEIEKKDNRDVAVSVDDASKYLDLRQKMKEKIRDARRKYSDDPLDMNNSSSLENFGSFFGPSTTVIADRVIQESRAVLDTKRGGCKKGENVFSSTHKLVCEAAKKCETKAKADGLKESRDFYTSFFSSEDAVVPKKAADKPAATKNSISPSRDSASATQVPKKIAAATQNSVSRRVSESASQMPKKTAAASKNSVSRRVAESAAQMPKKTAAVSKNSASRRVSASAALVPKKIVAAAAKNSISQRDSASPAIVPKNIAAAAKNSVSRRDSESAALKPKKTEPNNLKKNLNAEKPRKPSILKQNVTTNRKRKAAEAIDEQVDYSSMIRSIMGYDPSKYERLDKLDDRCMEVGFEAIQREERRSAKLGKKEDDEELVQIKREEERENLKKKAKQSLRSVKS